MALNSIEKKAIMGVGILILLAILFNFRIIQYNLTNLFTKEKEPEISFNYSEKMVSLPNNIKNIAKKYNAFNEIYNSDELLLVYGYDPLSVKEKENRLFHKRINELIKERNIKIKVIPYPNWINTIEQAQEDNGKDPSACTLFSAHEKDLETIIKTTKDCFMNACIVDAKNNKYVSIGKDLGIIIATIEKELGKHN